MLQTRDPIVKLEAYSCTVALVCSVLACTETSSNSSRVDRTDAATNAAVSSRTTPRADHSARGVIVVLGSSTSAGTGPKDPNNAWVSRYRAHLVQRFPNVALVNLAVGGYTTFEVQPTGYLPPPNRPAPVSDKNITAALALKPSALIVNLPSNDQASNYPLAEQLANYERIASLAQSAHVPLWISTTQPRNFKDPAQALQLMQARDAIARTFAPRTLDFWTPFAMPNGRIRPIYNSGDGTHLNDAAHAILADIVEAAHIPEQIRAAGEVSQ